MIKYEKVSSVNGVLACQAVYEGEVVAKYAVLRNGDARLLWVGEGQAASEAVAHLSRRIPAFA